MAEIKVDNKKKFCEFALICAKPEELRQVMAVLEKYFDKSKGDTRTEIRFKIPSPEGDLRLYVTSCAGMGHMNAAVRTAQVITSKQPSLILFVGTAASLKPSEVQIGDVIIPRKAINRIYEKISEVGQSDYDRRAGDQTFKETFFDTNALVADIGSIDSPAEAAAIATIKADKIFLESIAPGKITIGEEEITLRSSKIFDDIDIFSCGMVVDSISYRSFLVQLADRNMRKVGLIDMESYGFFSAIVAAKATAPGSVADGIMVRGVSDYAGRKQQSEMRPDGWKELSVRNAAEVAASLLKTLAALES